MAHQFKVWLRSFRVQSLALPVNIIYMALKKYVLTNPTRLFDWSFPILNSDTRFVRYYITLSLEYEETMDVGTLNHSIL